MDVSLFSMISKILRFENLLRYSEFIKAQHSAYCVLLLFAHFILNKQSA